LATILEGGDWALAPCSLEQEEARNKEA